MFSITSKYFRFFNNAPRASWVPHITMDILYIIPVRIIVPGTLRMVSRLKIIKSI